MLDGKLLATLEGHTDFVNAVAASPDGKLIASASKDKTIKLWSLPDGKQIGCLMDLDVCKNNVKGVLYKAKNASGTTVTYTLPCGSAIPAGAVCVCNCVPGSIVIPIPVAAPAPAPESETAPSEDSTTESAPDTTTTVPEESHYWYPN